MSRTVGQICLWVPHGPHFGKVGPNIWKRILWQPLLCRFPLDSGWVRPIYTGDKKYPLAACFAHFFAENPSVLTVFTKQSLTLIFIGIVRMFGGPFSDAT
eukprot:TRINITY_DN41761_c0_g1_i1.p1 TRINITY_DN41761_c0_g1~~TRINITY_DN41761_c0_g1_i1.p1  ORF type:complete len:100 (+),score=9.36 TRINITY_DN41761_c0_g1_i1:431-730(+)